MLWIFLLGYGEYFRFEFGAGDERIVFDAGSGL